MPQRRSWILKNMEEEEKNRRAEIKEFMWCSQRSRTDGSKKVDEKGAEKQTQSRYKKTLWVIHINTLVTHGLAMLHHKVATGQEQPI